MEELPSNQEHNIITVGELSSRLDRMEELFKELSSRVKHLTDATLASCLIDHTELANKVALVLAKPSPEGASLSSGQCDFPQSHLQYMMTSLSMPGIKFIGEKGRPRLHSYLWTFIHIVALLISYVLIKEEYDKWQKSPIVKTISNNLTYVNEIPFPAVTVCLPGPVREDYNVPDIIKKCILCNFTDDVAIGCDFNEMCTYEEKASLAIAYLVCPMEISTDSAIDWMFDDFLRASIVGKDFSMFLKNLLSHGKVEMTQEIYNKQDILESLFSLMEMYKYDGNHYINFVSSFGLCFTMNGFGKKDIFTENTIVSSVHDNSSLQSLEGLYKSKNLKSEGMIFSNGDVKTLPVHISENHYISFDIKGGYQNESDEICGVKMADSDFKDPFVAIHNPFEVPFIFSSDFELKFRDTKEIRVNPYMVTTEKGLESYKPMERGCFYSHERELAMFKHYSDHNCKTECTANCSLQHCGCVPYYLPRHNSSVRVCLTDCYKSSLCDHRACSCLPNCFSLSYNFEIMTFSDVEEGRRIKMSYKISGFYPTVRVSLTNLTQFMAYCLGIVGVFNGFSVMVLFEILYFVTFRLWNSLKSTYKIT